MTSLGHVIVWRMKHKRKGIFTCCVNIRNMGGHDQSQMKIKSSKKLSLFQKTYQKVITMTHTNSDKSGCHVNYEGTVLISCPNYLHHKILIIINRYRDHPGSQQACGNGQQLWLPLKMRNVKCGEECTDGWLSLQWKCAWEQVTDCSS